MRRNIVGVEDMLAFGEVIGSLVKGGEFIELVGDVGAGKTTLTKGVARGMGIDETIQSPTFTISRTYEADDVRLAHYDFYRLQDAGIMSDELAEAIDDPKMTVMVEWADAVRGVIPADHLRISFQALSDDDRLLELTATGPMSTKLLEGIGRAVAA